MVLSEDREVLELQLGGTLEVRCSGEGSPPPRVIWSFGASEDLPPNVSTVFYIYVWNRIIIAQAITAF